MSRVSRQDRQLPPFRNVSALGCGDQRKAGECSRRWPPRLVWVEAHRRPQQMSAPCGSGQGAENPAALRTPSLRPNRRCHQPLRDFRRARSRCRAGQRGATAGSKPDRSSPRRRHPPADTGSVPGYRSSKASVHVTLSPNPVDCGGAHTGADHPRGEAHALGSSASIDPTRCRTSRCGTDGGRERAVQQRPVRVVARQGQASWACSRATAASSPPA